MHVLLAAKGFLQALSDVWKEALLLRVFAGFLAVFSGVFVVVIAVHTGAPHTRISSRLTIGAPPAHRIVQYSHNRAECRLAHRVMLSGRRSQHGVRKRVTGIVLAELRDRLRTGASVLAIAREHMACVPIACTGGGRSIV